MRRLALLILLPVLFLAPFSASAATVNFFGPIVPEKCNCLPSETGGLPSAPDWGCVLATIQNLVSFAIAIGVIIVVFMVAYAGILWIASPFNPHNREEGRNLLMGSIIGLVIVLCSWLLVDFVMKFFYNETRAKDYAGYEEISYLPWESILGGNTENKCFVPTTLPDAPVNPGNSMLDPILGGSCATCVNLKTNSSLECKSAASCTVVPSLKDKLSNISFSGGWIVTEAYPPTRSHRNQCHGNGTCVDVGFRGTTYSAETVEEFIVAARAQGLRADFEEDSQTCPIQKALAQKNIRSYCKGTDPSYSAISGSHFSVYLNQ